MGEFPYTENKAQRTQISQQITRNNLENLSTLKHIPAYNTLY